MLSSCATEVATSAYVPCTVRRISSCFLVNWEQRLLAPDFQGSSLDSILEAPNLGFCLMSLCFHSRVQANPSRWTVRAESSFPCFKQYLEKFFAFQKLEGAFGAYLGLQATCESPSEGPITFRYDVQSEGAWMAPWLVGREVICNYCWGPWIKAVRKLLPAFIFLSFIFIAPSLHPPLHRTDPRTQSCTTEINNRALINLREYHNPCSFKSMAAWNPSCPER